MTVSPNPIAMAIVTNQRRNEQLAQASHYRLATLAQGSDSVARRPRKADRYAVAAMISVALALVAGRAAADAPAPTVKSSHVYAAHVATEAHSEESPYISVVQKVREAAP